MVRCKGGRTCDCIVMQAVLYFIHSEIGSHDFILCSRQGLHHSLGEGLKYFSSCARVCDIDFQIESKHCVGNMVCESSENRNCQ